MKICILLGASSKADESYFQVAKEVGALCAKKNFTIIYGAGTNGLMGALASSAIENNGKVIGIIPHHLVAKEGVQANLTECYLVDSMHERKAKMLELSDVILTLPGGIGTLEELFEFWCGAKLGLHSKPIYVLNQNNFYNSLFQLIDEIVEKSFLNDEHKQKIKHLTTIKQLEDEFNNIMSSRDGTEKLSSLESNLLA